MSTPYYQDNKGIVLYHGDCLEVMAELPDRSFDAIITDPPYGTTACNWDTVIPFVPMWAHLKRLIRPRGAIVLFGSQPFTSALVMSNPGWFKYEVIWRKSRPTGFLDAQRRPLDGHENMCIFAESGTTYNPVMQKGTPSHGGGGLGRKQASAYGAYKTLRTESNNGLQYPRTVVDFPSVAPGALHTTQKPLPLLEYLIRTYTNEGDHILDFTAGSGTTLRAAKNLRRRATGIELLEHYCAITVDRLAPQFEDAIVAPASTDYGPLFEGL